MQIGAARARRARGPDQRVLVLVIYQSRDVGGERRARRQAEAGAHVERCAGGAPHLVGIDAGCDDRDIARGDPIGHEHRPDGFRNGDDAVGPVPHAARAHVEVHAPRGDERRVAGPPPPSGQAAHPVREL